MFQGFSKEYSNNELIIHLPVVNRKACCTKPGSRHDSSKTIVVHLVDTGETRVAKEHPDDLNIAVVENCTVKGSPANIILQGFMDGP